MFGTCYPLSGNLTLTLTPPVQEVISDLDEEDSALDDTAISDDSNHEDEEGGELQVLNKYSKV